MVSAPPVVENLVSIEQWVVNQYRRPRRTFCWLYVLVPKDSSMLGLLTYLLAPARTPILARG